MHLIWTESETLQVSYATYDWARNQFAHQAYIKTLASGEKLGAVFTEQTHLFSTQKVATRLWQGYQWTQPAK